VSATAARGTDARSRAWRGLARRPLRVGYGEGLVVAATGLVLGALVLRTQGLPSSTRFLAILVLAAPFVAVLAGDVRRLLLAAIVIDLPFQWDTFLRYDVSAAKIGALGGINVSVTTLALAGLYGLWVWGALSGKPGTPGVAWRAALPLGVFVALVATSTTYAEDPTLAWFEVALLVQMPLLFVYLASTVRAMRDVELLAVVLFVGLLAESVLIILAFTTGQSFNFAGISTHNSTFAAEGFRPAGTLGSPNTAGAYLSLLIPIALATVFSSWGRRTRLLAGAAVPLGVYALVVTQSRGAWIAFVVALGALVIGLVSIGLLSARRMLLLFVVGMTIAVVAAPVVSGRLSRNDDGAAESRVPLMRLAGDMIRDNPVLGVGANNFSVRIDDYAGPEFSGDFLYAVHNKYLLVWAETGIGALIAYLWFIGSALARGWRVVATQDTRMSPLALGLVAALLGHLVHMTVDVFRGRPGIEALVLFAGLLAAMAQMVVAVEHEATSSARNARSSPVRTAAAGGKA
jgi:putative inorganic carbon (HCO3(-)) transporter